jgi:hypothetical protein
MKLPISASSQGPNRRLAQNLSKTITIQPNAPFCLSKEFPVRHSSRITPSKTLTFTSPSREISTSN